MIKIKKKKKAESSPAINIEEASSDKNYTIRHLKTDYPVGEDRIKQLALTSKRLVPCEITSEDDYYVFSYEIKGLKTLDRVKSARLIDKYELLINVSFLEELTDIYSFSLNPDNLMIDIGFRAYVLDRTFQTNDSTFLAEYKALAGAVLDGSHSYEDFLKGGNDLFSQTDVLSKVLAADSVNGVVKAVTEEAAIEQKNLDENFVTVKKEDIARHKVLLPVLCTIMIIALALLGYEYFYKGRTNKKILNATEQYFAEDYGSVGKTLTSLNEGKMTDSTRYMAAVSAVRSSGLTAVQKDNILKAINRYKTNKDYLNYWVMIGREDYIAADDYAQKFGDNEHRVFALAQRRAQVSKDSSMSGAKKTATINKLDEEIKKLLEAIKEDKYGLTNKSGASGASAQSTTEASSSNTSSANSSGDNSSDEPKLLN